MFSNVGLKALQCGHVGVQKGTKTAYLILEYLDSICQVMRLKDFQVAYFTPKNTS